MSGVVKRSAMRFNIEFRKQASIAIVAAFVFLIALVWRDFISELVTYMITLLGLGGPVYVYRLITAVFVTGLAVLGIVIVSRMNAEMKG